MISNKNFLKFINDKSLDLSESELKEIIENELEKTEDEIDTDLIEYCLDALNEKAAEKSVSPNKEKSKKKLSVKKAIAVIAASFILIFGAVTASADLFDFDIPAKLAEYYDNYVKLKSAGETHNAASYTLSGSALVQELEKNGISPVTLPEALLDEKWKITEFSAQADDMIISSSIRFQNENKITTLSITKYIYKEFMPEIDVMYPQKGTHYQINNLDVFVIKTKKAVTAYYTDGSTEYVFVFNFEYDKANEIIQTIK